MPLIKPFFLQFCVFLGDTWHRFASLAHCGRILLDSDADSLRFSQVDLGKISSFFQAVFTFIEEFVKNVFCRELGARPSHKLLLVNLHNLNF